jgi:YidC/Oxa1 family membrane protein insertase
VFDFLWNDLLINPMINGLIFLSRLLFNNFGLAIIVFTLLVRLATMPLTLRQLHASRRMSAIQPRLTELQKKHKDPKRRSEETMKIYREEGINPAGCLGPMLIQMPILFALYAVLTRTVGGTPERIAELSQLLYPWSFIQHAVPLPTQFLWLDLGRPDILMPFLVFVTTWLQTKLSMTTPPTNAQTSQTNAMMLWLMPVMFAWFTLNVPSGLGLYWVVSNVISIVMNYFVYSWRTRPWTDIFAPAGSPPGASRRHRTAGAPVAAVAAPAAAPATPARRNGKSERQSTAPAAGAETRPANAQSGSKRKDRRGGAGPGARPAGPRPLPGRRRGRQ